MPRVQKQLTQLAPQDAENLLAGQWEAGFGETVSPRVLRLLLALWDLETATGEQMFNWNFGNIIASSEDQQYYEADDSGNLRRFRAYPSAEVGASALIQLLGSENRMHWWRGLLTGNPERFVEALATAPAYFEADPATYQRAFITRWGRYGHLSAPKEAGDGGPSPSPSPSRESSALRLQCAGCGRGTDARLVTARKRASAGYIIDKTPCCWPCARNVLAELRRRMPVARVTWTDGTGCIALQSERLR